MKLESMPRAAGKSEDGWTRTVAAGALVSHPRKRWFESGRVQRLIVSMHYAFRLWLDTR